MARKLTRREFLLTTAATTAGIAAITSCKKAPALVTSLGEFDLSKPDQVRSALEKEGATVQIHTWGFEGLRAEVIPAKFAEYTQRKFGIPVKYTFSTESFGNLLNELPIANKTAVDAGIDVIDKEEEYWPRLKALEWTEPIDQEGYAPILENVKKVEDAYQIRSDPKVNGSNLHGVMYQGFEWLQAILRKDKVDINNYKDWTDLARAEMKDKGVLYPLSGDSRGHFVFMGILNSLIKQGIVKGGLWEEASWEAGFKWWKENMEDKIHKWGDIGNNPDLRLLLETGEVWWGGTWGVYTRAMLALPWNRRDNALWAFYPKSGILADRETCFVAKGTKHPVAARVLIDWMMSTEFVHAGWYKDEKGVEQNRWGITEDKYLALYTGGVYEEQRKVMPDFAKPYYPENPGSLILPCNWEWYSPKAEWISKAYERIVLGA